jgi:hypothetical protein
MRQMLAVRTPGDGLLAEHGPDADILDILDEQIGALPAKATAMAATPRSHPGVKSPRRAVAQAADGTQDGMSNAYWRRA